jgi:hypothetical protein
MPAVSTSERDSDFTFHPMAAIFGEPDALYVNDRFATAYGGGPKGRH